MANILGKDKQIAIVSALAECNSIRGIERMTGVHRDTIMRLGVKVGKACEKLLDARMQALPCRRIEVDELWGFIGKKQRNATNTEKAMGYGDVWTFLAIDAESKAIPSYTIGDRDAIHTMRFMRDLSQRLKSHVQLSSDAMGAYHYAVSANFERVDYAQIVKEYASSDPSDLRRYSSPEVIGAHKYPVFGDPNPDLISTSYVERVNLTTRLHVKRLSRLTLCFSKKRENFEAAIALYLAYYNFCKRHATVRSTPAMALGLEDRQWTVENLLHAIA